MGSVMTTRTFSPPSMHEAFLFAQLSKNIEVACAKLRRHKARARGASFFLKTQEFTYHSVKLEFPVPIADPTEILRAARARFHEVYASGILYRATGITLHTLVPDRVRMEDLFGESVAGEGRMRALASLDQVNQKHGGGTLLLGSSLLARPPRAPARSQSPAFLYAGDSRKKALDIPLLGIVR